MVLNSERATIDKTEGIVVVNPEKPKVGVFCSHETGTGRFGPYDNVQLVIVRLDKKIGWTKKPRTLSANEKRINSTGSWCPFPTFMLADIIRALNTLHKEMTGDTVCEADETISQEFDEVGEMLEKSGFKDRGR